MSNWIGVDWDGCLVEYDHWRGPGHVGSRVAAMVKRVQGWLLEGRDVRILTARVGQSGDWLRVVDGNLVARDGHDPRATDIHDGPAFAAQQREMIQAWCVKVFGVRLPVTATKNYGLKELWDDRAIQVHRNTGVRADGEE